MPKAKNLKYLRIKANLTQQDFADEIGVSKATVIAWESRKRAIPVPSAKRIAEYFDLEYEEYCDVDIAMIEASKIQLTETEKRSLAMFRELPENTKMLFRNAIAVAYENNIKKEEPK